MWEGSQRSVLTTNLCILEVTAPLICRSFLHLYVLDTLSLVLLWVLDAYNKISEVRLYLNRICSIVRTFDLKCFGEFFTKFYFMVVERN